MKQRTYQRSHRQTEPRFSSHGDGGPLGDGVATTICPPKSQTMVRKGWLPRLPLISRTYSVVQSLPAIAQVLCRRAANSIGIFPNCELQRDTVTPICSSGNSSRSPALVPNSLQGGSGSRKSFPPDGLLPCGQVPGGRGQALSGCAAGRVPVELLTPVTS